MMLNYLRKLTLIHGYLHSKTFERGENKHHKSNIQIMLKEGEEK